MSMLTAQEALDKLMSAAVPLRLHEAINGFEAHGRVLAAEVRSTLDVPPMDNTQMDGYALCAADVPEIGARLTVSQRVPAGHVPQAHVRGTAARVFTGAMIPQGADTVVMQEQCVTEGAAVIVNHQPVQGEWIRRRGCDIAAGSRVLEAGIVLRPQDVALAASVGLAALTVAKRLKVAVFFTGDELAMPGEPLKPGAIYNSNRYTLTALLKRMGCEVHDLGIVPDSLIATREALRKAAAVADVIITSGGVSVGEEDHVKPAVEAEGKLDMWQIAIKPGKPLAFGQVRKPAAHEAAYFFGLPGNPVSSFITFLMFVRPFLLKIQGATELTPNGILLKANFNWPKADKRREYLRVRLNEQGLLDLFPNQNSAVLSSTVWATGLVDNPPLQTVRIGDTVRYLPFNELL
jgi:molybdopterin molybdotransferase